HTCSSHLLAPPPFPTRRSSDLSKSLGQTPLDPRDVFSVDPIRGQEFEARHAISPRDRSGLPPNRRLVLERALPMDADDQGVRLRSEEHTSELQSRFDLVCRLLL